MLPFLGTRIQYVIHKPVSVHLSLSESDPENLFPGPFVTIFPSIAKLSLKKEPD